MKLLSIVLAFLISASMAEARPIKVGYRCVWGSSGGTCSELVEKVLKPVMEENLARLGYPVSEMVQSNLVYDYSSTLTNFDATVYIGPTLSGYIALRFNFRVNDELKLSFNREFPSSIQPSGYQASQMYFAQGLDTKNWETINKTIHTLFENDLTDGSSERHRRELSICNGDMQSEQ